MKLVHIACTPVGSWLLSQYYLDRSVSRNVRAVILYMKYGCVRCKSDGYVHMSMSNMWLYGIIVTLYEVRGK